MSPLELGICLHYHSSCEDMQWVFSGAPIVDETMQGLIEHGIIRKGDANEPRQFYPTEKLHRFVEMLCVTPLPEQRTHWFDPRTDQVIDNLHGKRLSRPIVEAFLKAESA